MSTIRIIHNLPRSGGTIISKCIAAQKDIVLLSEIHPEGTFIRNAMKEKTFYGDPIFQAQEWYNIFDKNDKKIINNLNENFEKKIDFIFEKTILLKKKLLIRDWSFVDYFGKPFLNPTYKNSLLNLLVKKYKVLNFYIIRHPLELYISCIKSLSFFKGNYNFDFYINGYKNFFLEAKKNNIFKYEDFVLEPEKNLKKMCGVLNINFDKNYIKNLKNISLTGDISAIKSLKIYKKDNIAQSLISKENKDKIYKDKNYINLMQNLNNYY